MQTNSHDVNGVPFEVGQKVLATKRGKFFGELGSIIETVYGIGIRFESYENYHSDTDHHDLWVDRGLQIVSVSKRKGFAKWVNKLEEVV